MDSVSGGCCGASDDTWCVGTQVPPLPMLVNMGGALPITQSVSSAASNWLSLHSPMDSHPHFISFSLRYLALEVSSENKQTQLFNHCFVSNNSLMLKTD